MNTAAALTFAATMIIGFTGLSTLVWRDRRRTQPPAPDDPLDAEHWPPPADIYEATVLAVGDPAHIDFTAPAPTW